MGRKIARSVSTLTYRHRGRSDTICIDTNEKFKITQTFFKRLMLIAINQATSVKE